MSDVYDALWGKEKSIRNDIISDFAIEWVFRNKLVLSISHLFSDHANSGMML